MKKALLSKGVALISVVLSFLLILASSFSLAWLSFNTNAYQDNGNMSLKPDDTLVEYCYYKYNIKRDMAEYGDDLSKIEFNPYDLIFKARNRYTPVVVRIAIYRKESMPKEGTLTVNIQRQAASGDSTPTKELTKYSSSIMRFSAGLFDEGYVHDENPEILYDNIYDYVDNLEYEVTKTYQAVYDDDQTPVEIPDSSHCFVNVADDNTYTKDSLIKLNVEYTEDDWQTVPEDDLEHQGFELLNVCLYITYDEGLINYYKNQASSATGSFSVDSNTVTFVNDIISVEIGYSTEEGGE